MISLPAKHTLTSMLPTSPSKRLCSSSQPVPAALTDGSSIPFLLQLNEDDIWSLPKSELRRYFIALQAHARNPRDLSGYYQAPRPVLRPVQVDLPPLLLLPSEIRSLIYGHLMSPPAAVPIKGPHPRQLQTQIALSQAFAPAILRVNRQIFLEALPIFYGGPNQCVHITIDYNVWSHKVQRSDFLMSGQVTSAMRHFHITIHLGNEKKTNRPEREDSEARLAVVRKGVRKLAKWLGDRDIKSLKISWHEPPRTYTWEQKKDVLDEFRALRPEIVRIGILNWGLQYPGKKYQFRPEYLQELQRTGDSTSRDALQILAHAADQQDTGEAELFSGGGV